MIRLQLQIFLRNESKILLERFVKNGNTAKTRLDLADSGLNQVINVLTRFSELSIQAANDTYGADDRISHGKGNGRAFYTSSRELQIHKTPMVKVFLLDLKLQQVPLMN